MSLQRSFLRAPVRSPSPSGKFRSMPGGPRFGLQGQDKDILNDMGLRDANTMPIRTNRMDKTRSVATPCVVYRSGMYWHCIGIPQPHIIQYILVLALEAKSGFPLASNEIWHIYGHLNWGAIFCSMQGDPDLASKAKTRIY